MVKWINLFLVTLCIGTLLHLSSSPVQAAYTETTYYIHQDHLGSVVAVSDENGNNVEYSKYAPYGKEALSVKRQAESITERGYTGQIRDQNTSLAYYNARYYDPVLSRFISADSVNDQLNRYSYVGGNPVMMNDPRGNMFDEGDGGGGGSRRVRDDLIPDLGAKLLPNRPMENIPAEDLKSQDKIAAPYWAGAILGATCLLVPNPVSCIGFNGGAAAVFADTILKQQSTGFSASSNELHPFMIGASIGASGVTVANGIQGVYQQFRHQRQVNFAKSIMSTKGGQIPTDPNQSVIGRGIGDLSQAQLNKIMDIQRREIGLNALSRQPYQTILRRVSLINQAPEIITPEDQLAQHPFVTDALERINYLVSINNQRLLTDPDWTLIKRQLNDLPLSGAITPEQLNNLGTLDRLLTKVENNYIFRPK